MRRFFAVLSLAAATSLLAGCPVYSADSCVDSSDCANGFACDGALNECVADVGGDGPRCSVSSDCGSNHYCRQDGFCAPIDDCRFSGCPGGYVCEATSGAAPRCVIGASGKGGATGAAAASGGGAAGRAGGEALAGAGGESALGGAAGQGPSGGSGGGIPSGGAGGEEQGGAGGSAQAGGGQAVAGAAGTGQGGSSQGGASQAGGGGDSGSGGTTGGAGGSTAGVGGSTAGFGGSAAGLGGSAAGLGGSTAGLGGSTAGDGGASGGDGGTAGAGAGTAGSGGAPAGGSGGSAGAPQAGCDDGGLAPASGSLQLVSQSTATACSGGLSSKPLEGKLAIAGGKGAPADAWSFEVVGVVASQAEIRCNEGSVVCAFTFDRAEGASTTRYTATAAPFTVKVTIWNDGSFIGTAEQVKAIRRVTVPGQTDQQVVEGVTLVLVATAN